MPGKQAVDVAPANSDVPWTERRLLPLKLAGQIAGLSPATLYRLEAGGRVKFKRLGGRTLVEVASLIVLIDGSEDWTASDHGAAGRAKRAERAAQGWQ
ncbi:hypothetical protein [Mesorhizobium sp. 8]|uniref:hypothetical protein n=1 Tax=Mesorhizobium sp. 8 TaxID=2584466 RepID=UPI00111D75B7|nr:hypothetical protein [Mesorhizobium sp. 8]QDC01712.1 hypothetical protein FGU64_15480 [Mesorhizobium sp. 8]